MIVTEADIIKGLREIGVNEGDILFVHSSLSSFGYVEGGAETVINALMKVLGEGGTLAMPSFPVFEPHGEYGLVYNNDVVFDVRESPSRMGKITDVFWRYPGVKRSLHPTHSVACWGHRRDWLLEGHERCLCSCGKDTPFHKLCQARGKILLMGVTHESNTTIHTIEDTNGAPTRSLELFHPKVIDYEGREIVVPTYPHLPGFPRCYWKMEEVCKNAGIQKECKVGNSLWKLIEAGPMYEIGSKLVRENPCFFIPLEQWGDIM